MYKKHLKAIIGIILVIFTSFIAFGYLTYNGKNNHDARSFSIDNVVNDIKAIASEPDSGFHTTELAKVRDYLFDRLSGLGGNPQYLFRNSVKSKLGDTFDISGVYCKFDPQGRDGASSYIMLVAHFDSCFPLQSASKDVTSFGAADDGYGVSVILELLRGAFQYRQEWKEQGIKILFTNGEEHGLDGMRTALERYNSIFDNVGLIVNVGAMGGKGPALMFETAGDDKKLADFYLKNAKYPFIYSFMDAVYDKMPDSSGFTLAKTVFPGYNISVMDNVDYHTDKDCFDNINTKSLGHYGGQLQPMLQAFLTEADYSDPDFFRRNPDVDVDEESPVLFSVPGLGTFRFSKNFYYFFNALIFFLFCIVLCIYVIMRRIELKNVFRHTLMLFLFSLAIFGIGEGIAFLAAKISGSTFKLFSTKFIPGDNFIAIFAIIFLGMAYILSFMKRKRKSDSFVFEHLMGALLLMMIFSAVLLGVLGNNFFFMGPVACALIALLFHIFVYLNILSLPALLAIELLAVSFVYIALTALTIGSLGIVLFLTLFYMVMIVSLFECYMTQKR